MLINIVAGDKDRVARRGTRKTLVPPAEIRIIAPLALRLASQMGAGKFSLHLFYAANMINEISSKSMLQFKTTESVILCNWERTQRGSLAHIKHVLSYWGSF